MATYVHVMVTKQGNINYELLIIDHWLNHWLLIIHCSCDPFQEPGEAFPDPFREPNMSACWLFGKVPRKSLSGDLSATLNNRHGHNCHPGSSCKWFLRFSVFFIEFWSILGFCLFLLNGLINLGLINGLFYVILGPINSYPGSSIYNN